MSSLLMAVAILVSGGLAALVAGRASRVATALGAGAAVVGGGLGFVSALRVLLDGASFSVAVPWGAYGSLSLGVDPLSAFFLLPILGLSALAAVYGAEYLQPRREGGLVGLPWFWFDLLVASMVGVVLARNALVFLVAWEVMSLASFFLVVHEHEQDSVREAGWIYLVATHLGTAFLVVLFLSMGHAGGSLEFSDLGRAAALAAASASGWFLLAVVGFGTKAGFVPFHVWLPEAHPAAPSHVSAVMSGVMIKTGIYGLVRLVSLLGAPPLWWGWLLVGVGVTSGVLGVLFALAQHDLKRLLAYHSVENIGIIALGLGLGLLGVSTANPFLAAVGFAGGLLHVANHAVFKGLLFLAAGAVRHATGTLDLERLGGLSKRMPRTALAFLVGSAAICGLPPLNGFASEFLVYVGAFHGATRVGAEVVAPALAVLAGLALIGGLAAACFAKAYGVVFLGEPRTGFAAHDPGLRMQLAMVALGAACLALGLGAPFVLPALAPVVAIVSGSAPAAAVASLAPPTGWLATASVASLGLLALVAGLALVRRRLLKGRDVRQAVTWDCGYVAPTARMQYTASSFAQPLLRVFRAALGTREHGSASATLFPAGASLETHTPDVAREKLFHPLYQGLTDLVARLRALQQGRVQVYVLYIVLTISALLLWKLE